MTVLALNCGSSSLKYAVFAADTAVLRGAVAGVTDHAAAIQTVLDELDRRGIARPAAVGHRVVHGGPDHVEPALVDDALLAALEHVVPLSPLHLPAELATISAVRARFGPLPQVACFDTGFHRTLPEVARRFALPRALGVRRYGFHGLSYEHVVATLPAAKLGRAVLAHLGSGASMVAVRDGCSVDTTMGFTPTGGLVMATRSGDLDPGLLVYLLDHGYDARGLAHLVDREAGLLAISETTSDMRVLLERRATDPCAALAVGLFCYHARKAIGAFTAVLGGIDSLVFTGGIGEHAPAVRAEICGGLAHLGIELDGRRNAAGALDIGAGPCAVYIVRTDEERMIARHTLRLVPDA